VDPTYLLSSIAVFLLVLALGLASDFLKLRMREPGSFGEGLSAGAYLAKLKDDRRKVLGEWIVFALGLIIAVYIVAPAISGFLGLK
jgi:hypothetical protein